MFKKFSALVAMILMVIATFVAIATQAQTATPKQDETFGNAEIIQMHQAGLSDSVIVAKIQAVKGNYDTNINTLINLKRQGISNEIITAMLKTQQNATGDSSATPSQPNTQTPHIQQKTSIKDLLAQSGRGTYLLDKREGSEQLVEIEDIKFETKRKTNAVGAILNPFSTNLGGSIKCIFQGKPRPTLISTPRPKFIFYYPNLPFIVHPEDWVILRLDEKGGQPFFKCRVNGRGLEKLFIHFKIKEIYKDAYEATPVSDLPDGNYVIGYYIFAFASSSSVSRGLRGGVNSDFISHGFTLFTIKKDEIKEEAAAKK